MQIYPDESHGLEGVLGHLHHSMEDHLAICLGNVTLGTILEPLHHTDLTTNQLCCPFIGTVSRDGYFFIEGLNVFTSTFCVCADGFQGLSKAFYYPIQLLTFHLPLGNY